MPYRDERRLPLLDDLRIASPCDADWHGMPGDDYVRVCHRCDREVYNLAAMTRGEAELLLAERQGPLCVRMFVRPDGTAITSDCTVGAQKKRRRRRRIAAVAGAMVAAGAAATAIPQAPPPALRPNEEEPASRVPFHGSASLMMGGIGAWGGKHGEATTPLGKAIERGSMPVPEPSIFPKP